MSRTQSSVKNLAFALTGQAAGIIASFIARIVFLRYLNEEYLGLNGLFTNILTIFSLVELGIGPAMNFSLYKPLAENNTAVLKSLMRLYKRLYIVIGISIGVIAAAFIPFYRIFMDEVPDIPNLTLIYVLFAGNAVISYFFSYKRSLIICDEKRYIATAYRYAFYFVLNIVQIILLVTTHNYILFLSAQIVFTFAENVCVSEKADRMYPYLMEKNVEPVPKETSEEIKKNVKAMMLHKIGGMVVFSSDNIILSKFVGLTAVGLYSNYFLITDALNKVILQFFNSIVASVGNLNAAETDKTKLELSFNRTFFMNFWIFGFCSCCLWCLFNPFISLWLGNHLLFDQLTVAVIVINFYLTGMRRSTATFREATGAFYYDRYKPIVESVINIVASVILARYMGTAGVFLGTIISTLAMPIWIEPYVLYKYVFGKSAKKYGFTFIVYTLIFIAATILCSLCVGLINVENQLVGFAVKVLVCLIVPNAVFLICCGNSENFRFYINLGKRIIGKILKK